MLAIFDKEHIEIDMHKVTVTTDVFLDWFNLDEGEYFIERADPTVVEGSDWNIFRHGSDGLSMQTGILKHVGDIHPYILGQGTKDDYEEQLKFEGEWDE